MSGAAEAAAVLCPAKVNLALRVLGRRADGYHDLDVVFQAIDLWDRLSVRSSPELTLECATPGLPVDDRNLALRAARLLRERHGKPGMGGRLELRKAIPVAGGLGGGSSDAAGALLLCRAHWSLELSLVELDALARELGADVPFFLHGGTARGRGRGDSIEPLPFAGERSLLLGCPPFGLATAEIFSRVSSRLTGPRNGASVPVFFGHKWPEQNDFEMFANDLEGVVFEGWPELRAFRDALLEVGARAALLSGSGSTVYGVFPGPEATVRAAESLRVRFTGWRIEASRFVPDGVRREAAGGATGPGGEAGPW